MRLIGLLAAALAVGSPAGAATYYVDGPNPAAADTNKGTEAAPWRTVSRAGGGHELRPGDTVLIKSGVYRQQLDITVSGEPGRPITFAAAPGQRVVLKASEIVRGPWHRLSEGGYGQRIGSQRIRLQQLDSTHLPQLERQ